MLSVIRNNTWFQLHVVPVLLISVATTHLQLHHSLKQMDDNNQELIIVERVFTNINSWYNAIHKWIIKSNVWVHLTAKVYSNYYPMLSPISGVILMLVDLLCNSIKSAATLLKYFLKLIIFDVWALFTYIELCCLDQQIF